MTSLVQGGKGMKGVILVLLLSVALLLVPVVASAGDGIGQPSDGLNSLVPAGSGETSTSLESLTLFVTLSLVT